MELSHCLPVQHSILNERILSQLNSLLKISMRQIFKNTTWKDITKLSYCVLQSEKEQEED